MPFKSEAVRKCKWCDKPVKKYYDHKTGKVRGYICNKCNLGLHYMEDENIINSMIKYLRGGI